MELEHSSDLVELVSFAADCNTTAYVRRLKILRSSPPPPFCWIVGEAKQPKYKELATEIMSD